MIKPLSALVIAAFMTLPAAAAPECSSIADTLNASSMKVTGGFLARVGAVLIKLSSDECGSLSSVFGLITEGSKTGGRRLEQEKPFDEAAARANLQKALADPEIKPLLDKAKDISDDTERALYEAVIFDSFSYLAARDLRIQELKKLAKQST